MELQVGVKILLRSGRGKHLLLKRSAKKYPEVGARWDIIGGRIESGISLVENLKREVQEETRLDFIRTPIPIAAQDIILPDKHVVRLTYIGEISGEPTPTLNDESEEYGWFSIDEIRQLQPMDRYFQEILDTWRL